MRPWPCRLDAESPLQKLLDVNEYLIVGIVECYVTLLADMSFRVEESPEKRRRTLRTVLDISLDSFEVNWLFE
jgi:hypothetical protein